MDPLTILAIGAGASTVGKIAGGIIETERKRKEQRRFERELQKQRQERIQRSEQIARGLQQRKLAGTMEGYLSGLQEGIRDYRRGMEKAISEYETGIRQIIQGKKEFIDRGFGELERIYQERFGELREGLEKEYEQAIAEAEAEAQRVYSRRSDVLGSATGGGAQAELGRQIIERIVSPVVQDYRSKISDLESQAFATLMGLRRERIQSELGLAQLEAMIPERKFEATRSVLEREEAMRRSMIETQMRGAEAIANLETAIASILSQAYEPAGVSRQELPSVPELIALGLSDVAGAVALGVAGGLTK